MQEYNFILTLGLEVLEWETCNLKEHFLELI